MKKLKNILKAILIKLNLLAWYQKFKIYRRLKVVARNELKVMHRAQKDLRRICTSPIDYEQRLSGYMALAKNWHPAYRLLSTWIYSDGKKVNRTIFKISKPKIKLEVERVYKEEMKLLVQ